MKTPVALIVLSLVPLLAGIARLTGFATDNQARFAADPIPATLHIIGATAFATLGALQFAPKLRRSRWHRWAGRVLAPFGIIAAMSGIWMVLTWPPKQYDSLALTVIRVTAGLGMIVFIMIGLATAWRRDFVSHGRWMTRAYALGSAAGTQFFTFIPSLLNESLSGERGVLVAMGAGWLINIVVAEWVLAGGAVSSRAKSQGLAAS